MSEKHYNADYLVDTAKILKDIKLSSYRHFAAMQEGILVDLGCGTGMDVISLSQMLDNKVKVIGVDHDESLINIARSNTPADSNASFVVSEGTKLPFEDAAIDALRAERLVQHLTDPLGVFREAFRVLKAFAPVVIVESDWSSLKFYDQHVAGTNKIVDYLTNQKINNGWASQQLIHYFDSSGFTAPAIKVFPFVLTSTRDAFTYLWIDKIIAEMAEKGILLQEEKDILLQSMDEADKKGCFACSMNIVIASAQKP